MTEWVSKGVFVILVTTTGEGGAIGGPGVITKGCTGVDHVPRRTKVPRRSYCLKEEVSRKGTDT